MAKPTKTSSKHKAGKSAKGAVSKKAGRASVVAAPHGRAATAAPQSNGARGAAPRAPKLEEHVISSETIPLVEDLRLEKLNFDLQQVCDESGQFCYRWRGRFPDPPELRETGSLGKDECIEIYRFMLMNRIMEQQLENLYKQSKVVGGVYFGLGQEGNSVASAFALQPSDWMAPMIRNQGSLLVRGYRPRDVMMQYMAKAGSPTGGKDGTSHYGDLETRRMISPISMLGDLIPVMAGLCLGERMQGREVAAMTWIGDGGQSTGVFHEGLNFAAVQKLGLVLTIENNLWAYSTPVSNQVRVVDLACRALAYGVPGVIVDGTDPLQVYDAAKAACDRARAGRGPTVIEAKLMRMKGHAIHDAAAYVPGPQFEVWKARDPIVRFERYLDRKGWLRKVQQSEIRETVERFMLAERDAAESSPMPDPAIAFQGVYCDDNCHHIEAKFATTGLQRRDNSASSPRARRTASDQAHFQ